jgi:hypothetical protein
LWFFGMELAPKSFWKISAPLFNTMLNFSSEYFTFPSTVLQATDSNTRSYNFSVNVSSDFSRSEDVWAQQREDEMGGRKGIT